MTGNVLGERYLKKYITIALSSSQIFLDLYGIPLLSQKKCIILFSVNEKKKKKDGYLQGAAILKAVKVARQFSKTQETH